MKAFLGGIYLLKVNNGNRTMCDIFSKLKIKTPERRHWCGSGNFIIFSTLNRFHKLFLCFHFWLWTRKCWLGWFLSWIKIQSEEITRNRKINMNAVIKETCNESIKIQNIFPAKKNILKANNRANRSKCQKRSNSTMETSITTSMTSFQCLYCGFWTNSIIALVSLLLFVPNLFAGWTRGAIMQYSDWMDQITSIKII